MGSSLRWRTLVPTPPRGPLSHSPSVRTQFVDCRWELGRPGRGRELYLEGHIPGASFLDVDEDLAAPPGERGRHPLPDADAFATSAARAGIGEGRPLPASGPV